VAAFPSRRARLVRAWPTLAHACGLPLNQQGQYLIPSLSHQCKRSQAAGAPVHESLFVLTVLVAIRRRLMCARASLH